MLRRTAGSLVTALSGSYRTAPVRSFTRAVRPKRKPTTTTAVVAAPAVAIQNKPFNIKDYSYVAQQAYASLVENAKKSRDPSAPGKVEAALEKLSAEGVPRSEDIYRYSMMACANGIKIKKLFLMFDSYRVKGYTVDIEVINTLFMGCLRARNLEKAIEVVGVADEYGVELNAWSFYALIGTVGRYTSQSTVPVGSGDLVDDIWVRIKESGIEASPLLLRASFTARMRLAQKAPKFPFESIAEGEIRRENLVRALEEYEQCRGLDSNVEDDFMFLANFLKLSPAAPLKAEAEDVVAALKSSVRDFERAVLRAQDNLSESETPASIIVPDEVKNTMNKLVDSIKKNPTDFP